MGSGAVAGAIGTEPGAASALLRVEHLSKTFPGTRALDDVNIEVRRGEIHALLGNNGSGKSTLIKVLAGVHAADPGGHIVVGERRFEAHKFTSAQAKAAGLHFVHQIPAVFPSLSVAENLAIGRGFETLGGGRIDWSEQRRRALQLIERFHIHARPETPLIALGAADRTLVAIARALQDQEGMHSGVLVLDEPTAALPAPEVERLLETLTRYARDGQTILYVSHRLDEVLRTSQRMSILRDGKCVGTVESAGMDEARIVTMMLGHPTTRRGARGERVEHAEVVLQVESLRGSPVADVSLELRKGEILGLAGLVGSGASQVLRLLFGAAPRSAGSVCLAGEPFLATTPRQAIFAGVMYVPPDRASEASFSGMSVRANLSGRIVSRYFRGLRLRHDQEHEDAALLIDRYGIRTASDLHPLMALSGGNQQKVVLARALRDRPKLLLLDEPTQGVAVHARDDIHEVLRQAAAGGTAILIVSSDFDELALLCDRVLVIREGRVVVEAPAPLDRHKITELAHFSLEHAT